jgi:hypothetical protein
MDNPECFMAKRAIQATCLTAFLTGIIPALHLSCSASSETLKIDSRGSSAPRIRNRIVSALVTKKSRLRSCC